MDAHQQIPHHRRTSILGLCGKIEMFSNFEIAFFGPYPHREQVKEGWMSRVYSIDQAFTDFRRIYVHVDLHIYGDQQKMVQITELSAVIYVNPSTAEGKIFITRIIDSVQAVYCHTLHLAEHLLDYLDSGKICVDVHGITPEEEEMMGNPQNVGRYTIIEEHVLKSARLCMFVTNAMDTHYRKKYPGIDYRWTKVGIFEKYDTQGLPPRSFNGQGELPVKVIYAGGTQAWQNIDKMADSVDKSIERADFTFYSHEHHVIRSKISAAALEKVVLDFCEKERLAAEYSSMDFGFIVRDNSPVNVVACPTKLIEYLCYGVIPIVELVEIGDFAEYGYEYVNLYDFNEGFFPDQASRTWMIQKNLEVAKRMQVEFELALDGLPERVMGVRKTS
jgi:hypothetical protein